MVLLVGIGGPFYPKAVTFLLRREAWDGDVRSRPEAALDGVAEYIGVPARVILGMRDRHRKDAHWRCMAGVLSSRKWMVLLVGIGRFFYPKAVTFLLRRKARDGDVRSRPKAALDGIAEYIGVPASVLSFLSSACETASEERNIEETKIAATGPWRVLRITFNFLSSVPAHFNAQT